jgi:hypothetical protein
MTLNAGSGGDDLAGDVVSSKFWQTVLVGYSTGDGAANVVMADTGLPVVPETGSTWAVTQSGTWNITNISGTISLPTGAATAANQSTGNTSLASIDGKITACNTGAVAGTVTANAGTNLNTSALALEAGGNLATIAEDTTSLDGKVTACNTGAVVISSGTITGITNALPAGDNNIGNVDIVTLPSGNLGMQAMAASLSVVPASDITDGTYIGDIKFGEALPAGSNAIGKLAANSGVDIGDVDVTSMPANSTASDSITGAAQTVTISPAAGCGTVGLQITGTWVGQLELEGTVDGTNYQSVEASNGTQTVNATTSNDIFVLPAAGYVTIRVRSSSWSSGTAVITFIASIGTCASIPTGSIPAGTNAIGKLAANSGVDIGDVDVTSIAAGTNTIGGTISQQSTSIAYDGTTACTIKRATGIAPGTGTAATTTMVAAVASKKIRVLAFFLLACTADAAEIYIHNADNNILGDSTDGIPIANDADGDNVAGFQLGWNPGGWFETDTANEALDLTYASGNADADIIWAVTYIEVA